MAKVTELVEGQYFEIKLPNLFSKMKVSIDGRETAVGVKAKGVHNASFSHAGAQFVVSLKQKAFPTGYEFAISKNGTVLVSKLLSYAGKEMDARLASIPKWMFAFPVLAGAPVFLHGLIPTGVGAAGGAIGYKIVTSFQNDRPKLFLFGVVNIAATWALVFLLVGGFYKGLLQLGWLQHNEDYLKSTVEKTNAQLPIQVDQFTILQRASSEGDTLTLTYALGPLDLATFDKEAFLDNMRGLLTKNSCTDKDLKLLLKNGYWVRYRYLASSVELGSVLVSGEACKE